MSFGAASRTDRRVELTTLGLGVAQFGNLYRETTDEASIDAVDAAWASGIRYFDTAPHYGLGLSERRLGRALSTRPRDEYVISTKVGRLLVDDPTGAGRMDDQGFVVSATTRRVWDFSADGVRRSLEESLARTGLDRIDVVYLHDPDDHLDQAIAEALPALVELRQQGVLGAIGAGMNSSTALARIVDEGDVDLVMCAGRFTLLEQGALLDLLPAAVRRGVGVVVAGVYNSGLLARDRPPTDAKYDYVDAPADLVARARALADVCESHGITLPVAALAFPLMHPAVRSVVVGARTAEQVLGSVRRAETPVPAELWTELVTRGLIRADSIAVDP